MRNGFENEWKVTGKVYYLKELTGEFSASVKIEGVASRPDVFSSSILKVACLLTSKAYDEAKRLGMTVRRNATLSGHLESWSTADGKPKIYFIADRVEKVGGWE